MANLSGPGTSDGEDVASGTQETAGSQGQEARRSLHFPPPTFLIPPPPLSPPPSELPTPPPSPLPSPPPSPQVNILPNSTPPSSPILPCFTPPPPICLANFTLSPNSISSSLPRPIPVFPSTITPSPVTVVPAPVPLSTVTPSPVPLSPLPISPIPLSPSPIPTHAPLPLPSLLLSPPTPPPSRQTDMESLGGKTIRLWKQKQNKWKLKIKENEVENLKPNQPNQIPVKPERSWKRDPDCFSHLGPSVARKLVLLKETICEEGDCSEGLPVWDCDVCLSILLLDLKLTHDIYFDTPKCLLNSMDSIAFGV